MKYIEIKNANVNNLKSVSLKIPINKITCFAGPSGSGKSSLAFHTLYAESKRRFLNSFPTYLKFFSDRPAPVDVEEINPVLPVFGLPQTNPVVGTRSIVSDVMHLTEQLQSLYSNFSIERCPRHNEELVESMISDQVRKMFDKEDNNCVIHFFTNKESFITFLKDSPFPTRSIKENKIKVFDQEDEFWELLRIKFKSLLSLNSKMKKYIDLNIPLYIYSEGLDSKIIKINVKKKFHCQKCDYIGNRKLSLATFSPYNALGACSKCNGFGANLIYDDNKYLKKELSINNGGLKILEYKRFGDLILDLKKELKSQKISLDKPIEKLPMKFYKILLDGAGHWGGLNDIFKSLETKKYKPSVRIFIRGIQKEIECEDCFGSRLNKSVHNFYLFKGEETSYLNLWKKNVEQLLVIFKKEVVKLNVNTATSNKFLRKTIKTLEVACGIGLGHLNINRKSKTVSAGEYQRLLLLKYLSYEGTGSLFIFDEPSLGLSSSESKVLFKSFQNLVSIGNTIVLVEHSKFFHESSDYFIKMGPGAGKFGGEIIYQGKYKKDVETIYPKIKKRKIIEIDRDWISVNEPKVYGKIYSSVKVPTHEITWVRGASGTGKTSIFVNTLANKMLHDLDKNMLKVQSGTFKNIKYPQSIRDVIVIDSNINRYSSRSTLGSLTGLFSIVRKHFLNTQYAKSMGLKEGHFSANSILGQCPNCEGKGVIIVEMQFLEDIVLTCEDCNGQKLKPLYASLTDGNMSVHEAYSGPLTEVMTKIKLTPKYRRIWEYIKILKLDYLSLDRGISSLSGGEKQRIYLLSKLEKDVQDTLLIFENISFGLSTLELSGLSIFLNELTERNNTVVIIDQDEYFKQVSSFQIEIK